MISLTEGERVLDVGRHLVSCCQQREHIDPSGSVPFAKITPSATLCSQPKSGSALFLQVLRNHGQIWGRDLRCYAQFSCQMRGGHACRALTMAPAKAQQGLMNKRISETSRFRRAKCLFQTGCYASVAKGSYSSARSATKPHPGAKRVVYVPTTANALYVDNAI
jgi:hypothetical protein